MAALATLVLCPLLFILMLLLRITMCSPVTFRQKRPGLKGCRFWIYKFSTMGEAFDGGERPLPDVDRHIPFGQWLRTTSLDEIPELFNVLRGEMSLVGPRPLRMEYLSRYSPEQSRRHDVKPDISGGAQINSRNAISWEEKFKLDLWYVDHEFLALPKDPLAYVLASDSTEKYLCLPSCCHTRIFGRAIWKSFAFGNKDRDKRCPLD